MQIDYSKVISNLIQNNIEKVFKGIYKKGEQKYKENIIDTGKAFEMYLHSAVSKFNKVKTVLYSHKPISLYDFYVDVNIECGKDLITTENVENILSYSNCVTLFGSGGTGKSTLFKHLFLNTIYSTDFIPIFVELKDINHKEYACIEDFIFESLENLNFSLDKDLFVKSLSNGQYVIFFDAFDEVKESQKFFISNEIIRLTNKYKDNHYLVSSRPNNTLERGWDNFSDFKVQSLNKEQAIQLIENLKYEEEIKGRFLKQLEKGDLFKKHNSFCSNPLLLTIMLLTYEEFAEIPDKLHIFYSRAFDVLYSRHDATKGSFVREKRFEKKGLASDDFENVLSAFSAISYSDSSLSFTRDSLIDYIKRTREFTHIEFDIDDFKVDIVEAVCILALDGIEYKYQHRSFQEYFTAKFINNLTDDDQSEFLIMLLEENPNSIRDEIFNMLFELNRVKLEKNFLIPVLKEIKRVVKNDIDNELNQITILKKIYDSVSIRETLKRDNKGAPQGIITTFGVKTVSGIKNSKYTSVARFVVSKYENLLDDIASNELSSSTFRSQDQRNKRKQKVLEVYSRRVLDPHYNRYEDDTVTINFRDINKDDKVLDDILICSSNHIMNLKLALLVLENLEEKHKSKKSIRELFVKQQ